MRTLLYFLLLAASLTAPRADGPADTLNLASNMTMASEGGIPVLANTYDEAKDTVTNQTIGGTPITYGDVRLADEEQYSVYNFEKADVEKLWAHFAAYESECQALVDEYVRATSAPKAKKGESAPAPTATPDAPFAQPPLVHASIPYLAPSKPGAEGTALIDPTLEQLEDIMRHAPPPKGHHTSRVSHRQKQGKGHAAKSKPGVTKGHNSAKPAKPAQTPIMPQGGYTEGTG